MGKKESYNVMAVYDLAPWSGRAIFAGTLEEISNKRNWRLHTTRPGKFFTKRELVDENGDGFDGFILSMPGTDAVMTEIAKSDIPTVLVNITDRRLAAVCGQVPYGGLRQAATQGDRGREDGGSGAAVC